MTCSIVCPRPTNTLTAKTQPAVGLAALLLLHQCPMLGAVDRAIVVVVVVVVAAAAAARRQISRRLPRTWKVAAACAQRWTRADMSPA